VKPCVKQLLLVHGKISSQRWINFAGPWARTHVFCVL
jgi:hypothetical protein